MKALENEGAIGNMTNGIFQVWLRWNPSEPNATEPIESESSHHVSAEVNVFGAWEGTVTVSCNGNVARHTAANMFRVLPEIIPQEAIHDGMGELSNMVGGNLTTFLPEVCDLSTPIVRAVEGRSTSHGVLSKQWTVRGPHGPVEVVVSKA